MATQCLHGNSEMKLGMCIRYGIIDHCHSLQPRVTLESLDPEARQEDLVNIGLLEGQGLQDFLVPRGKRGIQ